MDTERINEIRKVKNKICSLMKEHNVHIEIGTDPIAGNVFYLCADEPHDSRFDDDIQIVHNNL